VEYSELGTTGIRISKVGLGAVTFGREIDRETSFAILDLALEQGINLLDTAPIYGDGASETVLGEWLRSRSPRPSPIVATKVSLDGSEAARLRTFGQEHVRASVEGSLRRLGAETIDLLQLHVFCPSTPLEETLEALTGQVRAGRVKYFGCSNFNHEQLTRAVALSDRLGLPRFQSSQPPYNLVEREIEAGALAWCVEQKISVLSYSPLAAGFLTGKYRQGEPLPKGSRFDVVPGHEEVYFKKENFRLLGRLEELAQTLDVTLPELAMSWVVTRPGISSLLVGAREVRHLELVLRCIRGNFAEALMMAARESILWPLEDREGRTATAPLRRPT
jgi:1-deoxyxylulose-5-phosphate synthase